MHFCVVDGDLLDQSTDNPWSRNIIPWISEPTDSSESYLPRP